MDVPPKSGGPFSVLLLRSPFLRDERVCTCLHSRSRLGNGGGAPARTQSAAASQGGQPAWVSEAQPSSACRSGSLTQCPVRLIIPPLCRKATVPRITGQVQRPRSRPVPWALPGGGRLFAAVCSGCKGRRLLRLQRRCFRMRGQPFTQHLRVDPSACQLLLHVLLRLSLVHRRFVTPIAGTDKRCSEQKVVCFSLG